MKTKTAIYNFKRALCLTIFLILFLPIFQWYFDFFKITGVEDKRKIVSFSDLDLSRIDKIPIELNRYFEDNYGFRKLLIRIMNSIRYYIFHISPTKDVMLGKKDWLFYSSLTDGDGQIIRDYERSNLYSPSELEAIGKKLIIRRNMIRNTGSEYVIVLVPNKGSIYPEYLPNKFERYVGESRHDQLVKYLADNTDLNIIALKNDLIQAKSNHALHLYEIQGTHWNTLGSFVGYRTVSKKLKQLFPNIVQKEWSEYRITQKEEIQELQKMLGVFFNKTMSSPMLVSKKNTYHYKLYQWKRTVFKVDENTPDLIPKAIIFGDSFFQGLGQFLFGHFKETHFLWTLRYNHQFVRNERPSIVIQEVVERYLNYLYL